MTYRIDDQHGTEISTGHATHNAATESAQKWANKNKEPCYVSEDCEEAPSFEVAPQSIYETLKSASGCAPVGGGNSVEDCDSLYDSETNDYLDACDLGISNQEYDAAVAESVACTQPEGHILVGNRRVYAL